MGAQQLQYWYEYTHKGCKRSKTHVYMCKRLRKGSSFPSAVTGRSLRAHVDASAAVVPKLLPGINNSTSTYESVALLDRLRVSRFAGGICRHNHPGDTLFFLHTNRVPGPKYPAGFGLDSVTGSTRPGRPVGYPGNRRTGITPNIHIPVAGTHVERCTYARLRKSTRRSLNKALAVRRFLNGRKCMPLIYWKPLFYSGRG